MDIVMSAHLCEHRLLYRQSPCAGTRVSGESTPPILNST
jgi:hypothetical protein